MEDWRRLKMAGSSTGFAEFMSTDTIVNPPGVAEVLEKMFEEQADLRAKQVWSILVGPDSEECGPAEQRFCKLFLSRSRR